MELQTSTIIGMISGRIIGISFGFLKNRTDSERAKKKVKFRKTKDFVRRVYEEIPPYEVEVILRTTSVYCRVTNTRPRHPKSVLRES